MSAVTTFSDDLFPFTRRAEGMGTKAYKDSGGVITIGTGLTMLDKTFAEYWTRTRGHALQMGDTITAEENDKLLGMVMNGELAPKVAKALPDAKQHEFDGSGDMAFNCGAGSLTWRWCKALALGDVPTAVSLLRQTALTDIAGHHLVGLEHRREAEAKLIQNADYGHGNTPSLDRIPVSLSKDDVKAYQAQLKTLGYYDGSIDGITIEGSDTDKAVHAFQTANGLVSDGKVGPATRATLARLVEAKQQTAAATTVTVGTGTVAGGADVATNQSHTIDWGTLMGSGKWAIIAGVIALAIVLFLRNRGRIFKARTRA